MSEDNKEETEQPMEPSSTDVVEELTDTLKRLQAEFENFKKRTEQDVARRVAFGHMEVYKKLLPVLDDFDRALEHNSFDGVPSIIDHLKKIMQDDGVQTISPLGETFDASMHEALLVEQTDEKDKDNTVSEVLISGYTYNDMILRHAKVKVAKYGGE